MLRSPSWRIGLRPADMLAGFVVLCLAASVAITCHVNRRDHEAATRKAIAQAQAFGKLADERGAEVARLRAALDALPPDPGPRPVPADAPAPVVVERLSGLGISPVVMGDGLGLTLADARTALSWGYEAQRVGPLVARLDASTALTRAQEAETGLLRQQVQSLTSVVEAQERRPAERNWFAGGVVGLDTAGRRTVGGFVGWQKGAFVVQGIATNNGIFAGAGVRW